MFVTFKEGDNWSEPVDLSEEMIAIAEKNAEEYDFSDRVSYVHSDVRNLPFPDETFDAVFTNGTLQEWSDPIKVFHEINRVLKPGGHYYIKDLRRDLNWFFRQLMYYLVKPKEIRPGFVTSVRAAYTNSEMRKMLARTPLTSAKVNNSPFGLYIYGRKVKDS